MSCEHYDIRYVVKFKYSTKNDINFAKQRPFGFDVNKQFNLYIKFLMLFFSAFVIGQVDNNGLQRDQFLY